MDVVVDGVRQCRYQHHRIGTVFEKTGQQLIVCDGMTVIWNTLFGGTMASTAGSVWQLFLKEYGDSVGKCSSLASSGHVCGE